MDKWIKNEARAQCIKVERRKTEFLSQKTKENEKVQKLFS